MAERGARINAPDTERFALSGFLQRLSAEGELQIHPGPIALADVARVLDGNPHAVLMEQVGPERARLVGNVTASRKRLALAFGTSPEGLLAEILRRLQRAPRMTMVPREAAPVQQVILTGDDADLTALPVHLQHALDGAPYISASMDIAIDPRTNLSNVGMRRMMLRGRREAGVDLNSPSDLRAIYEGQAAQGKPLPVAFVVGSHPIDHVGACMRIPIDETGILASLRDDQMPIVKCVTSDLMVPADAEFVLEGYLEGPAEPEGPYGEFLGYYGPVKQNPVFHLTAITKRRDAIFQTSTIAGRHLAFTDTAQLAALRTEVTVWRALEHAVREPVAVHATTSSGGMLNVRIALRQRAPGEARNAIAAAFGSVANVKHVFVVDPDIDVFSSDQIDWALATRFQADRDLVIQSGLRALPLDPSLDGARTGTKAGFDCTLPIGAAEKIEARIPEPPQFEGARFASLQAALADGPKTFEGLMAAMGSTDGREIVRALEALRGAARLARNADGRWLLKD